MVVFYFYYYLIYMPVAGRTPRIYLQHQYFQLIYFSLKLHSVPDTVWGTLTDVVHSPHGLARDSGFLQLTL